MKAIKAWMLGVISTVAVALSAAAYASDWVLWYTTHYDYAPSPYNFTSVRDCTWTYTTSYGGSWGVNHFYVASGSCPVSEQKVVWQSAGGYNNTLVYHK